MVTIHNNGVIYIFWALASQKENVDLSVSAKDQLYNNVMIPVVPYRIF